MTISEPPQPRELATPDFAASPTQVYRDLRAAFGAVAPATLRGQDLAVVLAHGSARQVLDDSTRFPAYPAEVAPPPVCPGVALLRQERDPAVGYGRDRALLGSVDQTRVRETTIDLAEKLVEGFAAAGVADLVGQYAIPLCCSVIGSALGVEGALLDEAAGQVIAMRSGDDAVEVAAARNLVAVMAEVVAGRRGCPGADVVSALSAEYGAASDRIAGELARIFHAAAEPTWNLLALVLLRMTSDDGDEGPLGSTVVGGAVSYRDAIDVVLYTDPPVDLLFTYPPTALAMEGLWLPADQPLAVSLTAANTDPAIHDADQPVTGNRAHLAWGAGARQCPAPELALLIVTNALERLLDAIPDITLACPRDQLSWRPGAGHRALAALPVRFAPALSFSPAQ